MKKMAMVPASQGGVVASMHASPESTPIPQVDTSSSTDQSMSSNSHPGPSVRVSQTRVLNQQLNVLNADPMVIAQASQEVIRARTEAGQIVAQASNEVARVQNESQRVVVAAESHVQQTRDEARQAVGRTIMEAESRISQVTQAAEARVSDAQCQAQSLVSIANMSADARVSEIQSKANSAVEELQNQALSRIQSLETMLQQQLEENRQLKASMESMQRDLRFHELKSQAKNSRIESVEKRVQSQPQVQGQSSLLVDQVHHATGLSLPVASGFSKQVSKNSESPCRAGERRDVWESPQQRDQLLQFSGEDLVNRIFGEASVVPSPIQSQVPLQEFVPSQGGVHSNQPQPSSSLGFQLGELTSRLNSLTALVQGQVLGQRQSHQSSRGSSKQGSPKKPAGSPPGSSSSSSSDSRGGGGGGGPSTPPRGSPFSRHSSSSGPSDSDPYVIEKRLMRVKQYDNVKLSALPKSAADARAFRNSTFNLVCKFAKGDERKVFAWIQECVDPTAYSKLEDSNPFPLLDRVLGSKLLELAKGTRFALHFQTIQETAQKLGRQPKGRQLLWVVFERYKMERDRGVALTQNHLLNLKMSGSDVKALEDFRNKFDFIAQALEVMDRPSDTAIRSLLFEQLKSHPKMQLTIDKFRNASSSSSKRTWNWLYEKLVEAIEIHQLEENTVSIEKSLANIGNKETPAAPAKEKDKEKPSKEKSSKESKPSKPDKPDKPKDKKPDKPSKESKPSKEDVNAAAAKGKGKGNGEKPKKDNDKDKEKDKKKQPCMYYGYDSCSRGKDCPYLHDPNNKYQGPKPKGLQKGSSSSAGAATVLAATCLASQAEPALGSVVSSTYAPQPREAGDCLGEFPKRIHSKHVVKGAINKATNATKGLLKSSKSKSKGRPCFPRVSVFEKAVKVFSAIAACVNPVLPQVNQEFLLDTGAGRNLISYKSMPDCFKEHVTEAPEKVQFATGGGIRPSAKALNLEGQLSGNNTFYALKDCPHALSVGIQVEQHRRPFIWFPGQLPYLIKADRAKDVVHHVPESAKIYASRVDENVPILSESVCVAMPASTGGSSGSKDPISSEAPRPLPDPIPVESEAPRTPAHPSDLPRSDKPLELAREILPHFGDEVDEVFKSEGIVRELGDEPIDSDDEESNPWVPSLREKLQKEAKSSKHALTHFPKNRYCEVCRRSKMLAKFHRKRGLEVDPDEIPPLHFGHKLRVDHIVLGRDLAKGSEGEQACLVCYDEYSGCFGAYPQTKRDTDANVHSLQKFGGTKAHGKALCVVKSDTAVELTDAVKYLGWLPDPSVPNDEVHNAKLERGIRSIKEGVRAILLKSGLQHEFWPRAIEYFCTAHSFSNQAVIHPNDSEEVKTKKSTETCYEAASGEVFSGLKLPFGCLVYYKPPKHRELAAFEPRTLPGIFVGWRVDAGYVHKGIHLVLDYESLRTNTKGCGRPIQVYQSELVDPNDGNWVFPLYEANMSKLRLFSAKPSLPVLDPKDALPFEGVAPSTPARKRRTYVTLERAIKYGKTPGCKGCERIAEGVPHTEACHERFRTCLEEERLAAEARAARSTPSTPVPETPRVPLPGTPAGGATFVQSLSRTYAPDPQVFAAPFASSHDNGQESDYWSFDKDRKAWKRVHIRPRKRLFAPTGKDCPFDSNEVFTERVTEWNCRNRKSTHKDNWQKTPYQRISQKSWVGCTWFYPKKPVDSEKAQLYAMQSNVANHPTLNKPRKFEAMFAALIAEAEDKHEAAEFLTKVTRNVDKVKPPEARKKRSENPTCFEFCCSKDSTLGEVNMRRGINHFRLSAEVCNMADDTEVDSLIQIMEQFPGADIFGSIPCGPWSVWQRINQKQYGKKFRKVLKKQRDVSMKILRNYIRCAEVILKNGGHCAFEWPKGCDGWKIPELMAFCKKHSLFVAEPQGCALGLKDANGTPHLKSWWVATSNWKLAMNLDNKRCTHPPEFKHAPLEGSATKKSAFYTEEMAQCISHSLYEHVVPAMPVKAFQQEPHNQGGEGPFAAVHHVLNRNEWHLHDGWDAAIQKELDGLLANNVWSYDEVISRDDLIARSKKSKKSINIGRLMTILSIKNYEVPSLRKLKARVVFRGDDIRTEDNTLAVLQESKVNPTGLVGLNANLMLGCCPGNHSSQSDVVRAYTQSYLKTTVETWVELSSELTPPKYSKLKRPCVKLIKSLYGHPESGYHWDCRFKEVMRTMGGVHMTGFQSSYWFEKSKLLLTLYVDDMILSGPSTSHKSFWDELQKHLEIEEPTKVERILGRKQEMFSDEKGSYVAMSMEDFLESSCEAYENLSKTKIKESITPYMPEGSINTSDWESRGMLADSASRILMKILWAARLCRPDFMKVIGDLTKRLTTWSVADDKRLHRLMGYVKHSKGHKLLGKVGDKSEDLKLCLYTDADHCSGIDHTKSTSGMMMAVEGPNTWFPLTWASRRQTATARSTTEAEMISLGAGLFSEALPTQEFLEHIFDRPVVLECLQDNSAVIAIVAAGYSPKLRHMSKTQRIELGSIYEVFEEAGTVLLYIKTDKQRADPLTKNLLPQAWPEALNLLGITPLSIEHPKQAAASCG